ncbi:MAG: Calx-beta domain-containing protein [Chitinophagales bacterium]|nr:hypothetical protein [Bacteroidota bacterium]MCB9043982.1 hypothetical protein [Chitinophagales bacterium]
MKSTNILFFILLVVVFSSCEKDPPTSQITQFVDYTFGDIPDKIEFSEADETHTITFTFNDNQITDVHVLVGLTGEGSATEGVDFTLDTHELDVAALGKAGEFSVTLFKDYLTEGNESFFIELSSNEPHGLPITKVVEVVILDVTHPDEFYLTFDWDVPFTFDGDNYTTCPFVDIDILIEDADGNDLGIYQAATGACPEHILVDNTWEDGDYYLTAYLWDNSSLFGLGIGVEYTLTVNGVKQTFFDATYTTQDNFTDESLDQANDNVNTPIPVGRINISNGTVTFYNDLGEIVGEG